MYIRRLFSYLLAGACAASAVTGCGSAPLPPPEAVLEGSWVLTSQDSGQNGKVFVFDSIGTLIEIRTIMGQTTFIDRNVHRVTWVSGQSAYIETRDGLIIEGSLNDSADVLTGSLRTELDILFTDDTLLTDLGPATLTKQ